MQIYNGRDSFYQWDTNQQVTHDNLSVGDEVHVYSPMKSYALVVRAYKMDDGKVVADIPNILLQSHFPITVYRILVDEKGFSTLDEYQFVVNKRAKPADYVYTETEVLDYRNLDNRLRALEGEGLSQAIADYLEENPIEAGATAAEAAQIEQNKQNIEKLNTDKLDVNKLPEAVNDALAQAKASGEFKGDPGEPGKDGQDGTPGKDGADGKDYILTEADKQEIAELASEMVDVPDSGGNADIQPLTFTGAVNATYDGSAPVTVEIPSGGGGSGGNSEMTEIFRLTTTEEVAKIETGIDLNQYAEIVAYCDTIPVDGTAANTHFDWYVSRKMGLRINSSLHSTQRRMHMAHITRLNENKMYVIIGYGMGGNIFATGLHELSAENVLQFAAFNGGYVIDNVNTNFAFGSYAASIMLKIGTQAVVYGRKL